MALFYRLKEFTIHLLMSSRWGRKIIRLIVWWIAKIRGMNVKFYPERIEIIKGSSKIIISANQMVYGRDLIKYFNNYFSAVVPEARGEFQVVDFSKPREHTLADSGVALFFTSLVEGGACRVI